jgi:hypothetical protein
VCVCGFVPVGCVVVVLKLAQSINVKAAIEAEARRRARAGATFSRLEAEVPSEKAPHLVSLRLTTNCTRISSDA